MKTEIIVVRALPIEQGKPQSWESYRVEVDDPTPETVLMLPKGLLKTGDPMDEHLAWRLK